MEYFKVKIQHQHFTSYLYINGVPRHFQVQNIPATERRLKNTELEIEN